MIYFFSILSFLFPNEINIANSVDWLCYNSGTVATVQVNAVKEEPFQLMEYNSDITINATLIQAYKGQTPLSKEVIIYSRLTYIGKDKWKDMVGKEVLVFLKDRICEKQCVYTMWDDDRGMINIESPGTKALTGDFRRLKNKTEIYDYGMDCIAKLNKKTAEPYFLETPYETEAYQALNAGSSCYLIVPNILYPKATKGMH